MSYQHRSSSTAIGGAGMNETMCRRIVAERSGGICELCDRRATNMHHRRNRSQGGRWEPSNILHLCGSGTTDCHGHVTTYPLLATRNGWTVRGQLHSPAEVSVWLPRRGWVFLDDLGGVTETEMEAR